MAPLLKALAKITTSNKTKKEKKPGKPHNALTLAIAKAQAEEDMKKDKR